MRKCAWKPCLEQARATSKYCSRRCSNRFADFRQRQRDRGQKPAHLPKKFKAPSKDPPPKPASVFVPPPTIPPNLSRWDRVTAQKRLNSWIAAMKRRDIEILPERPTDGVPCHPKQVEVKPDVLPDPKDNPDGRPAPILAVERAQRLIPEIRRGKSFSTRIIQRRLACTNYAATLVLYELAKVGIPVVWIPTQSPGGVRLLAVGTGADLRSAQTPEFDSAQISKDDPEHIGETHHV